MLALLGAPLAALALQGDAPAQKPNFFGTDMEEFSTPVITGPPNQPAIPISRAKGTAGTLVFGHNAAGGPGSLYMRITATTVPLKTPAPNSPAELAYERFMGPLTMKSLEQVAKSMAAMHHGWPRGQRIELSYSDKPAPAELNPASLATALAMDSLLRNYDIDPSYAALGVLMEDGSVDAVGSIPERLASAGKARIARIVVPTKNQGQVSDFLLSEGIGAFVGTQIFTVENFNEAGVLALTKLDPRTEEVVRLFASVQKTLSFAQGGAVGMLRNENVQGVLQKVLAAAPNHCSAQVLLDWGTGKKAQISFDGSVDVIDRRASDIVKAMRANQNEALKTPKAKITENLAALRFVADRLDPKARAYAVALARYAEALMKVQGPGGRPPTKLAPPMQLAYDAAVQQGNEEWVKLVKARQAQAEEKPKAE